MRSHGRNIRRLLTGALLAAGLVAGTYAYTDANVVPASKAGDGTNTITGYTVSAVHYTLGASPFNVSSVTFTLNSAPVAGSTIQIVLNGTDWYTCTNVGTAVTCGTTSPQATVLGATNLRVVVAD
jgi:hypothetical protein